MSARKHKQLRQALLRGMAGASSTPETLAQHVERLKGIAADATDTRRARLVRRAIRVLTRGQG